MSLRSIGPPTTGRASAAGAAPGSTRAVIVLVRHRQTGRSRACARDGAGDPVPGTVPYLVPHGLSRQPGPSS